MRYRRLAPTSLSEQEPHQVLLPNTKSHKRSTITQPNHSTSPSNWTFAHNQSGIEKDLEVWLACSRLHLHSCNASHVKSIESVQRRATMLVKGIRDTSHESRLASLGMITLEQRSQRGDLIQTYKFLKRSQQGEYFRLSAAG